MKGMTALLAALLLLPAGSPPQRDQGVDPMRVDKAIEKGKLWLLKQPQTGKYDFYGHQVRNDELVLYTLLHAGCSRDHPRFKALLKTILETPLERTYCVALQAMILQKMDARKYHARIVQCCQFLVDNQCKNGQWSYGKPDASKGGPPTDTAGADDAPKGSSTRALPKVWVKPRRTGPPVGDNSNSQYAALGLRACMESGVMPPGATLLKAATWWKKDQNKDGGWGYRTQQNPHSFGGMTAGAVASLIIHLHYLRRNWKQDPSVIGGIRWMAANFTVTKNPKANPFMHYYYLYAMERVGMLASLEKIGAHAWYKEGAELLLGKQHPDGAWAYEGKAFTKYQKLWDTCFAILFLRRTTAPVETRSGGPRR
jgi:hypothetical protein